MSTSSTPPLAPAVYSQHPLSAAFPAMSAGDLQALTDDIEVNGQREPIVLFEGMVIDGWHRYQACTALLLRLSSVTLDKDEDPVAYVKSRNLHRRHLSGSQRAAAVVACSAWCPPGKPSNPAPGAGLTSAQMAKEADVAERTIRHAKAAHAAGLSEAVKDGKVTAKRAAEVAKLPEEQRATALAAPKPTAPAARKGHLSRKLTKRDHEILAKLDEARLRQLDEQEEGPSDAEMAEAERAQVDDEERVRILLESDDALGVMNAKCAQQAAQIRILEQRVAGLIAEKNEAVKIAKKLQAKVAKLEKVAT